MILFLFDTGLKKTLILAISWGTWWFMRGFKGAIRCLVFRQIQNRYIIITCSKWFAAKFGESNDGECGFSVLSKVGLVGPMARGLRPMSKMSGSSFCSDIANIAIWSLSHKIAGTGKCEAVKIGMGTTVSTNPMVCSSELRGIKQKQPPFHTWGCSST